MGDPCAKTIPDESNSFKGQELNLTEMIEALDHMRTSGSSWCLFHMELGQRCNGICPFMTIKGKENLCGLTLMIESMKKIRHDIRYPPSQNLTGAQKDCLMSLVRRVRGLEEDQKAHTKDICNLKEDNRVCHPHIWTTDHQKIGELETTVKDIRLKLRNI
jgi:hypothetical protein